LLHGQSFDRNKLKAVLSSTLHKHLSLSLSLSLSLRFCGFIGTQSETKPYAKSEGAPRPPQTSLTGALQWTNGATRAAQPQVSLRQGQTG
jgi:hypothetical protein